MPFNPIDVAAALSAAANSFQFGPAVVQSN